MTPEITHDERVAYWRQCIVVTGGNVDDAELCAEAEELLSAMTEQEIDQIAGRMGLTFDPLTGEVIDRTN